MSKTTLILCTTLVVSLTVGACLDRVLSSGDPVTASNSTPAPSVQPFRLVPGTGGNAGGSMTSNAGPTGSEMRAMLREELAAGLAKQGAAARAGVQPTSQATPHSAPVSKEVEAQRQEAMQTANEILAKGQWGPEERASFHRQLAQLGPAEFEQEMQRLVNGIDNHTISVHMPGVML
jgi:hypothetical protein